MNMETIIFYNDLQKKVSNEALVLGAAASRMPKKILT